MFCFYCLATAFSFHNNMFSTVDSLKLKLGPTAVCIKGVPSICSVFLLIYREQSLFMRCMKKEQHPKMEGSGLGIRFWRFGLMYITLNYHEKM